MSDSIYGVDRGLKLLLLLLGDVKYSIRVPSPFSFYYVPDSFDGVQLSALRWQELVVKPWVVKFSLHNEAMVDGEVVHYYNPLLEWVDLLELLDEGQEGVDGVAAEENLSKHQPLLDGQGADH